MALFIWKEEYSVGISSIDEQHKKLVSLLNELHSSMLSARANSILEKLLTELSEYTVYHFKNEENLMIDHKYSKYEEHKKNHKNFTDKVHSYLEDFKNGKKLLTVELLFFLKDWLINHINGEDKQYSAFFIERGVK
ncbi:MAG: hemerythrin family protein [Spirochaetes bacterium]|nr:hemerythrin family protein [Spirochaetota bacterium]